MKLFPIENIDELVNLEENQLWEDARELLHRMHQANPANMNLLVRLLFECWYVLVMWDCCMPRAALDEREFQRCLLEEAGAHLPSFHADPKALAAAGYMICIAPWLFLDPTNLFLGGDYEECKAAGQRMMDEAYRLRPDDPWIMTLCADSEDSMHRGAVRLSGMEWNASAMDEYFRDVTRR